MTDLISEALEVHKEAIVIDGLNASVLDEEYLEKLRRGGVTAVNYTVAMAHNLSETIKRIAEVYKLIRRNRDKALLVTSVNDIYKAKKEGRVGIILGFQNIDPLETNLDLLDVYHRLGVRIIQLTYHFRNEAGDGCKEPSDAGLSLFGRKLVERLNELGIVVDLAHVGKRTTLDAIRVSRHPAIFSHSNVKALVDEPQNKSDEEIKRLAEEEVKKMEENVRKTFDEIARIVNDKQADILAHILVDILSWNDALRRARKIYQEAKEEALYRAVVERITNMELNDIKKLVDDLINWKIDEVSEVLSELFWDALVAEIADGRANIYAAERHNTEVAVELCKRAMILKKTKDNK